MKKEAAAAYKRVTSDCYNISGYSKIRSIGPARSDQPRIWFVESDTESVKAG
jgi:hypothetical protein